MKKVISFIGMFLICSALVAQGDMKTRVYEVWDDQPAPNRGKDYSWIQSREGTLPSGLQGVWSQYHVTPWSGGYWHNINVQMHYWGAFNTNLPETFVAYEEYFNAYLPKAYENGRNN